MARKKLKFAAGGAQGRYDRRMADIEKDFKKDSAGKTGKAAEVLTAKRTQRIADAEDDRAKRTGADRTQTRAAETAAERNLTQTRKYGAVKTVSADPEIKATPSASFESKLESKLEPKNFKEAFKDARSRLGAGKTFTFGGKSYNTNVAGEGKPAVRRNTTEPTVKPAVRRNTTEPTVKPSKFDRQAFVDLKVQRNKTEPINSQSHTLARMRVIAEAPGASRGAIQDYRRAVESGMYNKAKGGKIKKMAKGGSVPPKPTAADKARSKAQLDSLKKAKTTAQEGKVVQSANRSEGPGYKKGGKMASCGMKKGGKAKAKSFAATKFGAAMMKKSKDTEGRAMKKFAKGGSIDGCAVKGKTKARMAMGGMAGYKRGGKTC